MNGHSWKLVVIGRVIQNTHYLSPPRFQGMKVLSDTWRCDMCGLYWATERAESDNPKYPYLYPGVPVPPTCQEIRDALTYDVMES